MALILNGIDQRGQLSAAFSMFNNSATYTIAVRVKPDTTAVAEGFIAGGYHNGGLDRHSGFVYRANQTPKTYAKVKSSSILYRPATPAAPFSATGAWDLVIASRNGVVGSAVASRQRVNNNVTTETSEENGASDLVLFGIGARRQSNGVYTGFYAGKIYDFACWNRVLTVGEEDSLAAGARLDSITSGLVDYVEFVGTGSPASVNTLNARVMNLVGSPSLDADTPYTVVNSFNGGNDIARGQQDVIYATTGFSTITSITTNQAGITVSGINDTAGDGNVDISDYSEGGEYPILPASVVFTFSGASLSNTITKTVTIKSGETSVLTSSVITNDNTYFGYWLNSFGRSTANGGQLVYSQGVNNAGEPVAISVDATLKIIADEACSFNSWYRDPGNGRTYFYTTTINGGGEVIDVDSSLSSVKLKSTKFRSSKLIGSKFA